MSQRTNTSLDSPVKNRLREKLRQKQLAPVSDDDDDDCELVDEIICKQWFFPIDKKWQISKCKKLNIPFNFISSIDVQEALPATNPCMMKNVVGDGNCFYRCLSFAITGSEQYHFLIRQHLLSFILEHPKIVERIANADYNPSLVSLDGEWPTEIEIFLSACMLETNIVTYKDEKWLAFGKDGRLQFGNVQERAIYLLNQLNHYQVIINVEKVKEGLTIQPDFQPVPQSLSPLVCPRNTQIWDQQTSSANDKVQDEPNDNRLMELDMTDDPMTVVDSSENRNGTNYDSACSPRFNVTSSQTTTVLKREIKSDANGDFTSSSNELSTHTSEKNHNTLPIPKYHVVLLTPSTLKTAESGEQNNRFVIDPISDLLSDKISTLSDKNKDRQWNNDSTSESNTASTQITKEEEQKEDILLIVKLSTSPEGMKRARKGENHTVNDQLSNVSSPELNCTSGNTEEPQIAENSMEKIPSTAKSRLIQLTSGIDRNAKSENESHPKIDPITEVPSDKETITLNNATEPQVDDDFNPSSDPETRNTYPKRGSWVQCIMEGTSQNIQEKQNILQIQNLSLGQSSATSVPSDQKTITLSNATEPQVDDDITPSFDPCTSQHIQEKQNIQLTQNLPLGPPTATAVPPDQKSITLNNGTEPQVNDDSTPSPDPCTSQHIQEKQNIQQIQTLPLGQPSTSAEHSGDFNKKKVDITIPRPKRIPITCKLSRVGLEMVRKHGSCQPVLIGNASVPGYLATASIELMKTLEKKDYIRINLGSDRKSKGLAGVMKSKRRGNFGQFLKKSICGQKKRNGRPKIHLDKNGQMVILIPISDSTSVQLTTDDTDSIIARCKETIGTELTEKVPENVDKSILKAYLLGECLPSAAYGFERRNHGILRKEPGGLVNPGPSDKSSDRSCATTAKLKTAKDEQADPSIGVSNSTLASNTTVFVTLDEQQQIRSSEIIKRPNELVQGEHKPAAVCGFKKSNQGLSPLVDVSESEQERVKDNRNSISRSYLTIPQSPAVADVKEPQLIAPDIVEETQDKNHPSFPQDVNSNSCKLPKTTGLVNVHTLDESFDMTKTEQKCTAVTQTDSTNDERSGTSHIDGSNSTSDGKRQSITLIMIDDDYKINLISKIEPGQRIDLNLLGKSLNKSSAQLHDIIKVEESKQTSYDGEKGLEDKNDLLLPRIVNSDESTKTSIYSLDECSAEKLIDPSRSNIKPLSINEGSNLSSGELAAIHEVLHELRRIKLKKGLISGNLNEEPNGLEKCQYKTSADYELGSRNQDGVPKEATSESAMENPIVTIPQLCPELEPKDAAFDEVEEPKEKNFLIFPRCGKSCESFTTPDGLQEVHTMDEYCELFSLRSYFRTEQQITTTDEIVEEESPSLSEVSDTKLDEIMNTLNIEDELQELDLTNNFKSGKYIEDPNDSDDAQYKLLNYITTESSSLIEMPDGMNGDQYDMDLETYFVDDHCYSFKPGSLLTTDPLTIPVDESENHENQSLSSMTSGLESMEITRDSDGVGDFQENKYYLGKFAPELNMALSQQPENLHVLEERRVMKKFQSNQKTKRMTVVAARSNATLDQPNAATCEMAEPQEKKMIAVAAGSKATMDQPNAATSGLESMEITTESDKVGDVQENRYYLRKFAPKLNMALSQQPEKVHVQEERRVKKKFQNKQKTKRMIVVAARADATLDQPNAASCEMAEPQEKKFHSSTF